MLTNCRERYDVHTADHRQLAVLYAPSGQRSQGLQYVVIVDELDSASDRLIDLKKPLTSSAAITVDPVDNSKPVRPVTASVTNAVRPTSLEPARSRGAAFRGCGNLRRCVEHTIKMWTDHARHIARNPQQIGAQARSAPRARNVVAVNP